MIELVPEEDDFHTGAVIKVVGVGGAGCNAINTMISSGLNGVECIAMNTDAQSLKQSLAPRRFQLGSQVTKGLGAGANPELGREAALENRDQIAQILVGADMVFVAAGMGGGTGTGAAPVVAEVARECGALTVGICTRPFNFEGKRRQKQAQEGIDNLKGHVDTLITIPNQRLVALATEKTSAKDTFRIADEVLYQAVKGVSDLINHPGVVNIDFADVRTIMGNKGTALMGVGSATGAHKTVEAAQRAISHPLLDQVSMAGATSVLINITGGPDLTLYEVNEASTLIHEEAHEDVEVIWGYVSDESMGDEVQVTVIATGFEESRQLLQPQSMERRINERVRHHDARVRRSPARNPLHSGVDPLGIDQYDIPTFLNHLD